ncbi:DNA metabolism protein [Heliorestis acidaminivorans]|uniref:DNA metabolism protein n=1 Tax=Heliorestis acidaminivorans TaxID=553427 RepID=A0A6I0EYY6_9FIRM|nr:TIGR03915 family putative DNA repair protein [Heliorestis acidaminivorans]KAB2952612.1 DNA metabolism protein [Heliorestis acidaminivorans]
MLIYQYDGSMEGLFTAIYEAYYRREQPEDIQAIAKSNPPLFAELVVIETDVEKSEKVVQSIHKKISDDAFRTVSYAFLSEVEGSEQAIYQYLRLGWKIGPQVDRYLVDPVWTVQKLRSKVAKEKHRMLGLLRFRLLSNSIYYGPMEPDHNIIGLIAPHFTKRLADQNWMIHDLRRGLAALYNQKEWIITDIDPNKKVELASIEIEYQDLWKAYFTSINIEERKNLKQQKTYMPFRYWRHLIEK